MVLRTYLYNAMCNSQYSTVLYTGTPSKETQTLDREKDALCRGRWWQLILIDGKTNYVNKITVKSYKYVNVIQSYTVNISTVNSVPFASSCEDNQKG